MTQQADYRPHPYVIQRSTYIAARKTYIAARRAHIAWIDFALDQIARESRAADARTRITTAYHRRHVRNRRRRSSR